jgi:predicted ATP-grasp superfamily ATP-dependent carboligase
LLLLPLEQKGVSMTQKIFVFEFISGGGFNTTSIPSSLFCEGFAMLRSLVDDFKKLDFHLITLLDHRIEYLSSLLNVNSIEVVSPSDNFLELYKSLVLKSDYCFVIAPEFSNILLNLSQIVKKSNRKLLSVDLSGIKIASSKHKTYEYFLENKLKTPPTYLIPLKEEYPDLKFLKRKVMDLDFPLIIKPDDGVGAESIYMLKSQKDLESLVERFKEKFERSRKYVIQTYIDGTPLSLSLLNFNRSKPRVNPILLSINTQELLIEDNKKDSEYFGGYTPYWEYGGIKKKISRIINSAKFPEFSSFFGIDFILRKDEVIFIEINPRLTTPYVGLRKILPYNLMELLMEKRYSEKYNLIRAKRNSVFRRIEFQYDGPYIKKDLNQKIFSLCENRIPEIITPPINFHENEEYSCFIATKESSLKKSIERIEDVVSYLEEIGLNKLK